METLSPQIDKSPKDAKASNSEMRTQVRGLISTLLYGQDDSVERRRQDRLLHVALELEPLEIPAQQVAREQLAGAEAARLDRLARQRHSSAPRRQT